MYINNYTYYSTKEFLCKSPCILHVHYKGRYCGLHVAVVLHDSKEKTNKYTLNVLSKTDGMISTKLGMNYPFNENKNKVHV